MITGRATPEGTERFRRRFADRLAPGHFRQAGPRRGQSDRSGGGLWLSSIGLGTYLGEADEATDRGYEESILAALAAGCNVFDAAINYRHQRSERALGRALARALDEGLARRDEVFVSTKGGFLPFDGEMPDDPHAYLREVYFDSGLLAAADLAAGCHAVRPEFLADQLERSRRNLGLATVDLYYLHNPEAQLESGRPDATAERLRRAFAELESRRAAGELAAYGAATWNAFRAAPGAADHLGLAALAGELSGPGFGGIQLPVNLAMPEALARPTQELDEVAVPALTLARKLGLAVFSSASILQGRLARELPPELETVFPGLETDAQRALQFTRSAPGVTTALVGMASAEHVRENLALAAVEPAGAEAFRRLFGGAGQSPS